MVVLLALSQSSAGQAVFQWGDVLFTSPDIWLREQGETVHRFFAQTRDVRRLQEENSALHRQLNDLVIKQVKLTEVETENRQLRALLQFSRENPLYSFRGATVTGRIIGFQPDNIAHVVTIDIGAKQGIRKEMPVIAAEGLVGRILRVHARTSEVLLLIDPSSAVDAKVQESRAPGLVRGRGLEAPLMTFVPQDATIRTGDIVLTSGIGGSFPSGLVIGQVSSVQRKDYGMYQEAVIRPTVDFQRLEQVLVITNFPPSDHAKGTDKIAQP